jgi:hypothetical protein
MMTEEVMDASAEKSSTGLPTAQELMEKLALKASQAARKHAAAEAEKKALL